MVSYNLRVVQRFGYRMSASTFSALPAGRRAGWLAFIAALVVAFALSGCGLLPEVKDETATLVGANVSTKRRTTRWSQGNYTRAVKLFETLESRFPYGRYAQQAILEGAYANYRAGETAAAVAACDRFIRTYPNHPNVDYAYYLKGLVNFREDQGTARLRLRARSVGARAEGDARVVRGVQGARRQVPGQPLRGGFARPDAATSPMRSRSTK